MIVGGLAAAIYIFRRFRNRRMLPLPIIHPREHRSETQRTDDRELNPMIPATGTRQKTTTTTATPTSDNDQTAATNLPVTTQPIDTTWKNFNFQALPILRAPPQPSHYDVPPAPIPIPRTHQQI